MTEMAEDISIPDSDLGLLIYEHDDSVTRRTIVALAIVCTLSGLAIAWTCYEQNEVTCQSLFAAGFFIVVPGPAAAIAFANRVDILRCYSEGIVHITSHGTARIRYDSEPILTFTAIRIRYLFLYSDTLTSLVVETRTEEKSITYDKTVWKPSGFVFTSRDFISSRLAEPMLAKLQKGAVVPWTDGARFRPEGLELPALAAFGQGGWAKLPYREVAGESFADGRFFLYRCGSEQPVFSAPANGPNFYPGLALLGILVSHPLPDGARP
ncbi:MAG: hypothetical protein ACRC7O_14655 [Fimbriiglobus sp.]